jgi:DNA-binding transcriptional LysR family regulator
MQFDQFATMAQAAIHGLGLALLPMFLIGADLATGRLVPAFGPPLRALGSYYLVWPENRPPRPALTSFRSWVGAQRDLVAGA